MAIWFTSDTHFYHKAIIRYCNRPVRDVGEMNEWLIDRWNSRIGPDDVVYHLGDFAFCGKQKQSGILARLQGRKYLVRGNHDNNIPDGWEWVRDYYKLYVQDTFEDEDGETKPYTQRIVLCHFPILSWDYMAHGSWHLHGHCHGSLPPTQMMRYDVGVDCNDWKPISYEEIKKIMVMRSIVPVDHHGL